MHKSLPSKTKFHFARLNIKSMLLKEHYYYIIITINTIAIDYYMLQTLV